MIPYIVIALSVAFSGFFKNRKGCFYLIERTYGQAALMVRLYVIAPENAIVDQDMRSALPILYSAFYK